MHFVFYSWSIDSQILVKIEECGILLSSMGQLCLMHWHDEGGSKAHKCCWSRLHYVLHFLKDIEACTPSSIYLPCFWTETNFAQNQYYFYPSLYNGHPKAAHSYSKNISKLYRKTIEQWHNKGWMDLFCPQYIMLMLDSCGDTDQIKLLRMSAWAKKHNCP